MKYREWKASELKDIVYRREDLGQKWSNIAKAYGATESAVRSVYHYHTRTLKLVEKRKQTRTMKWTEKDKEKLIERKKRGYTHAEIANLLGTTVLAVQSALSRMRAEG